MQVHFDSLQDELTIFKTKSEEFEMKYTEVQKRVEELLKDTEESNSKIGQLQEMIER